MSGWCCSAVSFLWARGKVKGEAEAGVGQGKGAAWVYLPHFAGGLREDTYSVQGTAGFGGFLFLYVGVAQCLGPIIRDF